MAIAASDVRTWLSLKGPLAPTLPPLLGSRTPFGSKIASQSKGTLPNFLTGPMSALGQKRTSEPWIGNVCFMLESGHLRARTPLSRLGFRTRPQPYSTTPCRHYSHEHPMVQWFDIVLRQLSRDSWVFPSLCWKRVPVEGGAPGVGACPYGGGVTPFLYRGRSSQTPPVSTAYQRRHRHGAQSPRRPSIFLCFSSGSGGGTRTPDTRIMILPLFTDLIVFLASMSRPCRVSGLYGASTA